MEKIRQRLKPKSMPIRAMKRAGHFLSLIFRAADETARAKSVEILEHEVRELNHCFALLVFGAFVGLPMPPAHVTLDLLEVMEKELDLMSERLMTAHDPLGELFSVFSID